MPAPLAGRRILDLGAVCEKRPQALAISMATKLCAGYGAAVFRPLPAGGEPLAAVPPVLPGGRSALDLFLNRDKIAGGAAGAYDAAIGDGAGLAAHAASVPITVRVSAFGPGEDPPQTELSLLALSGILGLVGGAEGPPARLAGHQLAYAAGLAACTGLLAAFHGGGAEAVDVSLFDVGVWLNWKAAAGMLLLGTAP
ncbi:MAG TPA: CoA transferase, partial [Acetobacteraceae bacterium]|nr:CoA transferase [Acetobacteraceae bacterium]